MIRWPGLAQFRRGAVAGGWNGKSPLRTRLRITLLGLLALDAVLLALLFHRPGHTLGQQQQELTRVRDRRDGAKSTVAQMRELRAKLQVALQNGQSFAKENFQARSSGFSAVLTDLEHQASENRLKPSGVSYRLDAEKLQPGWTNVGVTLTVEGEYPDLIRFINHLEQSDLFWIIRGLTVTAGTGKGLRMSLQMETYFIPS